MFTLLFWLALVLAFVDWVAAARGWKRARWASKPATLILLLAWFNQQGGWDRGLGWAGAALIFSLLGDVLLMLPPRYFLAGAGAFFLAHGFYILGFSQQPITWHWAAGLPMLVIAAAFSGISGRIRGGLRRQGEPGLVLPVMAYAGILSLMWLMALSTLLRPAWPFRSAVLVSAGAGLFFVSDSILSYSRFVREFRGSNLAVMVTYHAAQFLITTGVLFI